MALITVLVLIFIRLDFVLKCQADTLNQIMDLRQEVDEVKESIDKDEKVATIDELGANTAHGVALADEPQPIGPYTITHYCSCAKCCGKTDGITASGTQATAGRTIAAPKDIPFGTTLIVDGIAYTVEDRGGAITGNHLDIYCDSHEEAVSRGRITRQVYRID